VWALKLRPIKIADSEEEEDDEALDGGVRI
jgi:hypothetical protein